MSMGILRACCERLDNIYIIRSRIYMKITQRVEAKADQNNPIFCQAGFGQDSLSYTLCSSYSRWPKGWMDNDICDICHSWWLCAFFACFSIPFLFCISESNVGPCWTICPMAPSLFLPRSLRPLITRVTRNFRFSRTCINISLSSLTFALTFPHSRSRKICQKYRARKGGEGRKFRNNLHLQTGLIISPLILAFPNFIIY